jgi:hypothetical protein
LSFPLPLFFPDFSCFHTNVCCMIAAYLSYQVLTDFSAFPLSSVFNILSLTSGNSSFAQFEGNLSSFNRKFQCLEVTKTYIIKCWSTINIFNNFSKFIYSHFILMVIWSASFHRFYISDNGFI